jgi:hypothetical protein
VKIDIEETPTISMGVTDGFAFGIALNETALRSIYKTMLLLISALMLMAGVASAQSPATSQSCVAVSIANFPGTDFDNFVLSNNCGQTVTLY